MNAAEIFHKVTEAGSKIRIKLLGDSITHGVGGTGFAQDGEEIVPGWNRNPNGYCWAKKFQEYMESHYNCEVINNGCTGITAQFILEHWTELVDAEDDIILCTIGTNNRNQFFDDLPKHTREEHMEVLYRAVLEIHERLKASGVLYVMVANIPAAAANEVDGADFYRVFHMNDVNDLYKKAAKETGFPFISLYDRFTDYCRAQGIAVESLLFDGLHPNDTGYDVIYELLMKEIGLS